MQSYIIISHTNIINPISYIYSICDGTKLKVDHYNGRSYSLLDSSLTSHSSISKPNSISVYHGLEAKHSTFLSHDVNYADGIILGRLVTKNELLIAYETFGHHFHKDPSEMYIRSKDKFMFYNMDLLTMTEIGIPLIPDEKWVDYCKLINSHLIDYSIKLYDSRKSGLYGSHIPVEDGTNLLGFKLIPSREEVIPISRPLAMSLLKYIKAVGIYNANNILCKRCDSILARHIYCTYNNNQDSKYIKTNILGVTEVPKEDIIKHIKKEHSKLVYRDEIIEDYNGLKDIKNCLLQIDNRSSEDIPTEFLERLISDGNILIITGYASYHYPDYSDDIYYYTCTTNMTIHNKISGQE